MKCNETECRNDKILLNDKVIALTAALRIMECLAQFCLYRNGGNFQYFFSCYSISQK